MAVMMSLATSATFGAIAESQVLVVYNSAATDATTLKNAYLAAHPGILAVNVLNLNNAALNVADLTYAQFVSLVRNPIRAYLAAAGAPDPPDIIAIVLIRPFPHRIQDTNHPTIGDNPSGQADEINAGDATDASVDAELVLLWQNLETGEAGGTMDSKSDNIIDNPYHQLTAQINTFSRTNIQTAKTFSIWRVFDSGQTARRCSRLATCTRWRMMAIAPDAARPRSTQNLYINKAPVGVLMDEYDVSRATISI
jgi:hypothetical protein